MQNTAPEIAAESDIEFRCAGCKTFFVVDAAAAGKKIVCQKCRSQITIPRPSASLLAPKSADDSKMDARRADLQRQLTENQSQRTEIFGYINQLSIQLHRWQLRLQKLIEREKQIETEIALLPESDR